MGSRGRMRVTSSTVEELELPVEAVEAGETEREETGDELIDRVEYDRDREYTRFKDNASGTHEYAGSGQEQIDFFSEYSNSNYLISNMDSDERAAFRYWTQGWFMDGQQYHGFSKMDEDDQRRTRIYDKILDKATLDEGIVVTRRTTAELLFGAGKKTATLDELKAMRGQMITAKGNMSTGVANEGLTIGASGKTVEYRIHIPGGSTGAGMWIGDSRVNDWAERQREFITNRDSVYAVGRTSYDKKRKVYRVNLYYVGREKHDYS